MTEGGIPDPPRIPPGASKRAEFLAGAVYGFKVGRMVGREEGFAEGVKAMHRAFRRMVAKDKPPSAD